MIQKKHITILLMGLFLATFVTESYSQRRSSRSDRTSRSSRTADRDRDRDAEVVPFTEKLTYDILLGNPYVANNFFEVSGKFGVGYKLTDFLAVGLGPKFKYDGDQFGTSFIYGGQTFAKVNLGEAIYLRAEYDYLIRKNFDNISSPLAGIGYLSGYGKWRYGLEVLLPFSAEYRTGFSLLDYMFSFVYNM